MSDKISDTDFITRLLFAVFIADALVTKDLI